MKQTELANCL